VGLVVAGIIQEQLTEVARVERWDDPAIFPLGSGTLDSLLQASGRFDFAVFVFTPDYLIISSSTPVQTTRDNILFELGLFMGRLGRDRTFLVCCNEDHDIIPYDLRGITFATYSRPTDKDDLSAALEPACYRIRKAIEAQGEAADWQKLRADLNEHDTALRSMQMELETLRMALEGAITQFEYDKLEGLDHEGPFLCWFHENMRAEMRRLVAHGYAREAWFGAGRALEKHRHSGRQFDLKDHFALTDKGRAYLHLRRDWQARAGAVSGGA
jgi:hypothetical protein